MRRFTGVGVCVVLPQSDLTSFIDLAILRGSMYKYVLELHAPWSDADTHLCLQ